MKGYERSPDMTMRLGSDFVDFLIRNPQARLEKKLGKDLYTEGKK